MNNKVECMRIAGRINQDAIKYGFENAKPGVRLTTLDEIIEKFIVYNGGRPAFKGYKGYPAASCLCPNDVVIHGVPTDYELKDGDILTIDLGTEYGGWNVDSAKTQLIYEDLAKTEYIRFDSVELIACTNRILKSQLSVIKAGCSLLSITIAAEENSYSTLFNMRVRIFPQFGGHAIGKTIHEDPYIPNIVDTLLPQTKKWLLSQEYEQYKLQVGQVICIEPVTTFGKTDIIMDADQWTIRTADGSPVAHAEHCVLVTENGYELLS